MICKTKVSDLEKLISKEVQDKHFSKFSKQSRYFGNGVYGFPGTNLFSRDTRTLFLMFCAVQEDINFINE